MFSTDSSIDLILRLLLLSPIALTWLIVAVRKLGLRTFSKMTAVDFVVTVASGSLLASAVTATAWPSFIQALGGVTMLLILQKVVSLLRQNSNAFKEAAENEPLLLMKDGAFIPVALEATQVTESDVIAKLREANALDLSEVKAVVLETTGDISVLHGGKLDERLLDEVQTVEGNC